MHCLAWLTRLAYLKLICMHSVLPLHQVAYLQTLNLQCMLQIAVRTVESDQTRLDQVVKMLGYLHQHFSGVADAEVKRVMLAGLEMRFADYDQPPLVMSYILNQEGGSRAMPVSFGLMAVAVNAAGCERIFSQMGLTHTKLRNRLGVAKVTHLAQLRQELKKKKTVETASASASTSASGRTQDLPDAQDQLMDLDALTSADEFWLAVNEWFGDLDAEHRLAGMNFSSYQDSSAVVKTTLSSLCGSALMPILTEEAASSY